MHKSQNDVFIGPLRFHTVLVRKRVKVIPLKDMTKITTFLFFGFGLSHAVKIIN